MSQNWKKNNTTYDNLMLDYSKSQKVYVVNKKLLNLSWDALPDWDISEVEKERRKTVMR